jgi:hypothetical protein
LRGRTGQDAYQLAVVCHCRGAEDWASDELGAGVVDGLCELVGGVGVDCGAVDEQLALDVWRFQGGVDCLGDGLIVAYAGEDDVCC